MPLRLMRAPTLTPAGLIAEPRHRRPRRVPGRLRIARPRRDVWAPTLLGRPARPGFTGSWQGLVLLEHAGRDPPAVADRDAVGLRPRPDVAAALAAGRGPRRPASQSPAGLAVMLDERPELLAEGAGVPAAQFDLILRALPAGRRERRGPAAQSRTDSS